MIRMTRLQGHDLLRLRLYANCARVSRVVTRMHGNTQIGAVAQLVERFVRIEEVVVSTTISSTLVIKHFFTTVLRGAFLRALVSALNCGYLRATQSRNSLGFVLAYESPRSECSVSASLCSANFFWQSIQLLSISLPQCHNKLPASHNRAREIYKLSESSSKPQVRSVAAKQVPPSAESTRQKQVSLATLYLQNKVSMSTPHFSAVRESKPPIDYWPHIHQW